MNCPHCNKTNSFRVRETRLSDGDIVRTRVCIECDQRFGTREKIDKTLPIGTGKGSSPKSQKNIQKAWPLQGLWK